MLIPGGCLDGGNLATNVVSQANAFGTDFDGSVVCHVLDRARDGGCALDAGLELVQQGGRGFAGVNPAAKPRLGGASVLKHLKDVGGTLGVH